MKPHIAKTISEIDQDIASLQSDIDNLRSARATLDNLYGGADSSPEPEEPKRAPKRAKPIPIAPEQKPRPEFLPKSDTPREGLGKNEKCVERIAALRTLPEPFTPASFAVAAGIDKKLAGIALCGYATRGWIARVGSGKYQRSQDFPRPT